MVFKKRGIVVMLFALVFVFSVSGVRADTLFYDGFSATHPLSSGWTGHYAEPPNSVNLTNDIYSNNNPSFVLNGYYMVTKDDAAATISINTVGYENIDLSYARRAFFVNSWDILRVEWRIGNSGNWSEIESTQANTITPWGSNSFSFPGSAENQPEIQIRFWLDDGNADYALWDEVEVTGDLIDSVAPMCSVDYLEHRITNNVYNFSSSIYIGEVGQYYIYGDSWDNQSNIDNVQYNRSSPNIPPILWTDADPVDLSFNSPQEEWRSDPNDPGFVDGWHNTCCSAVDDPGNVGDGTCQEFCVDTQNPNQVMNVIHSNPSSCVSNYVNEAPGFSWDYGVDNGCSGVGHYDVEVYYSNGSLYYVTTASYPLMNVTNPVNGEDYYIRTRAVDNAGNAGDWSNSSGHVWYDIEDPNVDIVGEPWDVWYNGDFNVTEIDTDNLGLYSCEYRIWNSGNFTLDWTTTVCNQNITIDVTQYCPFDGLNNCRVYKRIMDNACNEDSASRQWDLDREEPETTKIITGHKYPGFNWNNHSIDWFVTDETNFTFNCYDNLSGCDETFYRTMFESNPWSSWMAYNGSFNLNEGDGVYNMEYYSTDIAGNQEEVQNETDKVDTIAPVTTKEIGQPQYVDGLGNLWVSGLTNFTLTCEDSEVGCNQTCYDVQSVGGSESGGICGNTPLVFDLNGYENGLLNVSYWSQDHLWNMEDVHYQTDWLDTVPPSIQVLNPTIQEALNVQRCTQSVVAIVQDAGSGVQSVWAELEDSNGTIVRNEVMYESNIAGLYETLMDKQLHAGNYTLKVYAKDNVQNTWVVNVLEVLPEDVFVEYLTDPSTGGSVSCEVNINSGGTCDLRFNVCMRGADSVKMWMDKFGDVVTPTMMDATILKNNNSAYVGLMQNGQNVTDAGLLDLDEGVINGRSHFDLGLNISANHPLFGNIAQAIGPGEHDLEYLLRSFLTI